MKGIYTRETKDRAKACYMHDERFADIARNIGCNPDTVGKWSKQEGWAEERIKLYAESTDLENRETSNLLSDKIKRQKQIYEAMLSKGTKALQHTDVKSANEAAQLIEKAIKGIESIRQDTLNAQFICEVSEVLKSKIQDRNLLLQIAEDFRKVFNKHHNKGVC